MCGIIGIFAPASQPPADVLTLRRMLGVISHRGPDEFGVYLADHVALGSARLSIVDLAGGQQPLVTPDERYAIVYNGEVFNYRELRAELEQQGVRFTTATDTEVVLQMLIRFGPSALARFNGQFALAFWDGYRAELLLARDRLGVRPLFYAQCGSALVFASEVKGILASGRLSASLDPLALDQIFTTWGCLGERTSFSGVKQLPPATYMRVSARGVESATYWTLSFGPPSTAPAADLEAELGGLLSRAVSLRLQADVPVSAYLSGGLDSSLLTAIACREHTSRLETFSIAFEDPVYDERLEQQRVASLLGTNHHVLEASYADIATAFPAVVWHVETPILRTSPVPLYLLSGLVHAHDYKVVLTGEGADEFFGGYDIFKETQVRRFWAKSPASSMRSALLQRLHNFIPGARHTSAEFLAAFYRPDLGETSRPDYSHLVRWRTTRRLHRFYSAQLKAGLAAGSPPASLAYPPGFDQWHSLSKAQYLEITLFLSQYLLSSQGDRVAMAHSVEGRFPFLDPNVVSFALTLPPSLRLRGLTEKYLLRQLASRWLPPEVAKRPKQPYRAPIARSFFGPRRPEYVDAALAPDALRRAGLFEPAIVQQLVAKAASGSPLGETDEMALVGILSSQLWHHHFVESWSAPDPLPTTARLKLAGPTFSTPAPVPA